MNNARERIKDILARFCLEEEDTLETLRDCRAIISGPVALFVLEGQEECGFVPSDIDIYVPVETFSILRDFITINAGYVPAHVSRNSNEIHPSELMYGARSGTGEMTPLSLHVYSRHA